MELDEVSIEESSMMNSLSYSWTTRKKRSLKPFKSKGFSSSSSREEEEEEGRTRSNVFNRKRKRKVEENGDEFEVIPKSDKEEQCSEDDDYDCILGEWMRRRIVKRTDKRKEEVEVRPKIESEEHFEDVDYTIGNFFSDISSKRRDRRQVELEEDEEWEEQVRLCSKIRATSSRTRTRNLGSNSPENVIEVSPSHSRSPASDVSDSIMKNGISNDCTIMKHTSKESKEGPICHQCLKGERITLLICSECEETMYCLQCIRKWYPHLSEDDVVNKCPFCCKNCNCSKCLHLNGLIETSKRELTNSERRHHLQYSIVLMLPFLNKLSHSQKQEIEIEAKVQGLLPSEVEITEAISYTDERVYCDHCATSIVDLHRSCPKCSYELCLKCCQEIREESLSERPKMKVHYVDKGCRYMHGLDS